MTELERTLKILFATHYFINHSRKASKIATVVCENVTTVFEWCQTPEWKAALEFWDYTDNAKVKNLAQFRKNNPDKVPEFGDLDKAKEVWTAFFTGKTHKLLTDIITRDPEGLQHLN